MTPEFWNKRWQNSEIGFHEGRANALLVQHWSSLNLPSGAPVFVPLCGKAIDMAWLAGRGHAVIGVELSAIATRDFFAENGLSPTITARDGFEISSAGGIEIWCGDLFKLEARHLAGVAAVYDRASLVALPPDMQVAYAAKITEIVPPTAPTLLIAFNYDQSQAAGPPFATSPERVRELFADRFDIVELARQDTLDSNPNLKRRGLTWLEEGVLVLRRR